MSNIESNQIGFSDEFTYNNEGIKYEITQDGKLMLYVEDCAKALGVTDTKTLKNGSTSTTVRWNRVYEDLVGIEKIANAGDFKSLDKDIKKHIRNELKSMTISESELYLWSFRVDSEQGKLFRNWLANVVLPSLREYGIYVTGMENMTPEQIKKVTDERVERYILRKFGISIRRSLTDAIKQILNPAPHEGYIYANYTNALYRVLFGMECKPYKASLGLGEKDSLRDTVDDNTLTSIAKAEEFMGNLIISGVSDLNTLENMIANWYANYSPVIN